MYNDSSQIKDFKRYILAQPVRKRQEIVDFDDTGLLDFLTNALTPTERALLFPDYFKKEVPVTTKDGTASDTPRSGTSTQTGSGTPDTPGVPAHPAAQAVARERANKGSQVPAQEPGRKPVVGSNGKPVKQFEPQTGVNSQSERMKAVYNGYIEAGMSPAWARAMIGENGRESSFSKAAMFHTHTDAANGATNVGMMSWQGSRARKLIEFLGNVPGALDENGRLTESVAAIKGQAAFAYHEIQNNPSYKKTREAMANNPDGMDDMAMATVLGKNYIRWRIDDPRYRSSGLKNRKDFMNKFDKIMETDGTVIGASYPTPSEGGTATSSEGGTATAIEPVKTSYDDLRSSFPKEVGVDSPIWDQVDPELKKARNRIVDRDGGLVTTEALIAADAASKVLRKNGLKPRIPPGGGGDDNHSKNHGKGSSVNNAIDLAASDANGKHVRIGRGVSREVKLEMAAAAQLASKGNFRLGMPLADSNASMHLQPDPKMEARAWGYTDKGKAGGTGSIKSLQRDRTGLGQDTITQYEAIKKMNLDERNQMLAQITGVETSGETQVAEAPAPASMKTFMVKDMYKPAMETIKKNAAKVGAIDNGDGSFSMTEETVKNLRDKGVDFEQYADVVDNPAPNPAVAEAVKPTEPKIVNASTSGTPEAPTASPVPPTAPAPLSIDSEKGEEKPLEVTVHPLMKKNKPVVDQKTSPNLKPVGDEQASNTMPEKNVQYTEAEQPAAQQQQTAMMTPSTVPQQPPQQSSDDTSANRKVVPKSYVDAVRRSSFQGAERGYWNPIGTSALV